MDNIQPNNLAAEEAVIGSVLINPSLYENIAHLKPEHFYFGKPKAVWGAICDLAGKLSAIDTLTISNELNKSSKLDDIGGASYLTELLLSVPSPLNYETYANTVYNLAKRRAIIQRAQALVKIALNESTPLESVMGETDQLLSIIKAGTNGKTQTWLDMQAELGPISWDWRPWLPRGTLTILAGESGAGKSSLVLRVGACYLMASEWPNREVFDGEPGAIVWCEAEAAQAINMERAVNWGLPLDMIYSPLSPTDDFRLNSPLHREALLHKAALPEVKFIVVDSLRGSMEGDENSSETIECVKWLAEVARDFNKVVVLLHHLRKRTMLDDGNGVDMSRVRGSSAILQPARMVWALDQPDPFSKDWKRLSVIKSNLAAFPEPLGVSVTDKGVLFGLSPSAPKTETLLDRAVDLLKLFLEHEPKKYIEVQEQCDQAGISKSTMNRAKDKLGINPVKTSTGWMWSLPPHTYIKS